MVVLLYFKNIPGRVYHASTFAGRRFLHVSPERVYLRKKSKYGCFFLFIFTITIISGNGGNLKRVLPGGGER